MRLIKSVWIAVTLALAVALAACVQGPIAAPVDEPGGEAVVADYQLGVGDLLRITVFGEERLTGEFIVGPGGSISYPLVGEVPALGRSVPQFNAELGEALQRFVREPRVSIEVLNYRPFYILGEVQSPGTYQFSVGLTVLNAVATAGGFSERASTRFVYIRHANEPVEKVYTLTTVTPVRPGDTIRIPERRF